MAKIIENNDIEKTKKELIKNRDEIILITSQNDNYNRKMIEYGKFKGILNIEKGNRKDSLRQIDSGLNIYLAKEAAKKKISLFLDMEEFRKLKGKEKAERIAKIIQNIKLTRKTGAEIKLLNVKDKKDAISFLLSLGASTEQASKAISF